MKKNLIALSLLAGCLLISSCASKKELENCQLENKELNGKYQDTKDKLADVNSQLAASKERVAGLEEQLSQAIHTSSCGSKEQERLAEPHSY